MIAVTGATGFIGRALIEDLHKRGFQVRPIVRNHSSKHDHPVTVGNIDSATDWTKALKGVTCVIHCAGRAHILNETEPVPITAFRKINVEGSRNLAEQAYANGVSKMVFLSSIGVFGLNTNSRKPFSILDKPSPLNDYNLSKYEAEQSLWEIADRTGLEVVVVRSPLVYGPGVKANFFRLMKLIKKEIPFPLLSVKNSRSFVALGNLTDLLIRCVTHPKAKGGTFLVADGQDFSTVELIRELAHNMNCATRFFKMHPILLKIIAGLIGKLPELEKLISSLQVDISHTTEQLQWNPPVIANDELMRTAKAFLLENRR